ncbi:MAG: T9SS type A sorting domain-containing protein [Chitinophagaceae bacterium]|nr:MAG: T9SS type A sorting domain-containing protein [Chitinophagaceae bacterium]
MRKIYLVAWLLVGGLCFSSTGLAQSGWKEVSEGVIQKNLFAGGRYKPETYRLFQLDETSLETNLKQAPTRSMVPATLSSFILTIPNSDGRPERFKAVESPVMEPALAAKYPGIKTYVGQGIDDPSATIHFDFSPRGFHAMVLGADRKTMYIDPVDREGKYYMVFSRKDVMNYKKEFRCLTKESADNAVFDAPAPTSGETGRGADDGKLRTYRLALACTGEYAQYFLNGTEPDDAAKKAKVLAAMATLLVRTNGIYERDFGIHMNLIANNDLLIYLNPSTDPWTNEWNSKTQATIDNVIGNANYDIGHLVHKEASALNNNGNAGCIACVCRPGMKGSAYTSHVQPEGDPFVVDFTTHEMGHQFGANHTYTFRNEVSASAQMEPGSGSTIMGYAGITGVTDVQEHSDDYFHAYSIQQVTDYVKGTTGGGCAVVTSTGNATPTADAGNNYTIPKSTPFALTGAGTDADAADILSYAWEQFDPGTSNTTFPDVNYNSGPAFRSRPNSTSATRVFPILSSILDGTNTNQWEKLPGVTRTMTFRLTVRDNHAGGGNTKDDDMTVTVASAGPFTVTSPNSSVSWSSNLEQIITWSVNGSDLAPVNCANVKISLSTDGGLTFPTVLAASTPNDGTEEVYIPSLTTNTARIKIEAVGNIFFDISDANFTLTPATPGFSFGNPAAASITCATQSSASITLPVRSILGYSIPVNLSASGLPAGTTVTFSTNPATPGNSTIVTLTNTHTLAAGSYNITIAGVSGSITNTRILTYTVQQGTGPAITAQPQSIAACAASTAAFSVVATNALAYQWQVSSNGGVSFTNVATGGTGANYSIAGVTTALNNYQYRVLVTGQCGVTISNAATLTVQTAPSITAAPQPATLCVGSPATFTVAATGTSLGYQWQLSTDGGANYNAAPGVNNTASYTIGAITTAMNNNRYRVVVNGTCAPAVTSAGAVLTVISPVVVTGNANGITICETGNVSFTVAGTSSVPVIYQWQVSTNGGTSYTSITNGGGYSGATAATLSINNVSAGMNNNIYRAQLSNATCTTPVPTNTIDPAVLTVNARPTVNLAASPYLDILPGQSTTISAAINPAPAGFNISWRKDDQLLPAITGTSYLVDSVEVGNYKVQIINPTTGCNNESNVLTIGTTASTNLFIFPTPNDGRFTVSYYNASGAAGRQTLAVYDTRGQRVYNAQLNVSGPYTLHDINLRGSAKGVYYVVIGDGSGKKITEGKVMIY